MVLPLELLVTIESWLNESQVSGSLSATLVKTGGNTAVLARDWTGWIIGFPSLPSAAETCEPDRNLLDDAAWVSERCEASALDGTGPLGRADGLNKY